MKIRTALIIGAGNVATHLGKALIKDGIKVVQIYSPSSSAKKLAQKLKAGYTNVVSEIDAKVDIIIIAIKDDAMAGFAKQIHFGNTLTVHTSGALPADVLKNVSSNYGVFYPFQTFNRNVKVNFANVPVCMEANTEKGLKQLKDLASLLVKKQYILNSDQRQWLHIMGVFSSNFTNLMFRATKDIADKQHIPFEIVFPLIDQTVEKVKNYDPASVQTGPANRGDTKVISAHLKKLSKDKNYSTIYQVLSNTIIDLNNAQ